ncbi:MAG: fibronectin type III domain-containing protein [Bacteroidota bacterium]
MKKFYFLVISLFYAFQIFAPSQSYSQCLAPTQLSVSAITQNSVTISWPTSNNVSHYNIRYQTSGSLNWVVVNNVSSPFTLTGLNCGGVYVGQVQQVCYQTGVTTPLYSDWSNVTFTTTPCSNPCTAPTGLVATNMSQTGVVLNLTPAASTNNHYNIRYHSGNSTTWITLNNVTLPYQLGNLPCGTGFEWQAQQICSTTPGTLSGVSPWSIGAAFSTLACANPCPTPTGSVTTNVNQTSAVLNWNPNIVATPSIYNIRYRSANSSTWIVVNNVGAPYQLGNLTCGTGYVWQVQQVCSTANTPSSWSVGTTFSTLACPNPCAAPTSLSVASTTHNSAVITWVTPNTTTLYNVQYRMDGNPNWVVLNNVSSPLTLTGLNCGGVYICQVQQVCSNSAGTAIVSPWSTVTFTTLPCSTPCVVPIGLTATNMTQTSAVLNLIPASSTNNHYNIRYHSGNSTTWITINNVTLPYQLGNLPCGTVFEWQVQQICSTTPGTLSGVSPWSVGATFSTLACPNPCVAPTSLSVASTTQNSAVITWVTPNTTTLYNVQYRMDGNPNWIVLNNVSSPLTLSGLNCGGVYICQVQQVCSNSAGTAIVSPWSTVTFTTLPCSTPCVAPIGLTATNMTQTSAVLNLTPAASTNNHYNIRYHSGNSTTWITINNVTLPYQLGNLTCGTVYEWQVQRVCTTTPGTLSGVSPWSVGSTFSTLACTNPNPCATPTGLSTTNINQTSAVLHWGPITTAASLYNIRYHSANSNTWIVVNNVTMPYQLGNLSCSSGYVWQVQKVCGTASGTNFELSPWSTPTTFSTSPCIIQCAAPTELGSSNVSQTTANLYWNAVSGAVGYVVIYKPINSLSAFITVTASSNSIVISGLTTGTSYTYQVRAICANGTTATMMSSLSSPYVFTTLNALVVSPNPANGSIRMACFLAEESTVTIQLRDSYGQLVSSINEMGIEGSNEFTMNSESISEGLYILTIKTNSETITSKVFIKH